MDTFDPRSATLPPPLSGVPAREEIHADRGGDHLGDGGRPGLEAPPQMAPEARKSHRWANMTARSARSSGADLVRLASFGSVPLEDAVGAFLAERDLATTSRRKYRDTLAAMVQAIGAGMPVADVDGRQLVALMRGRWATAAPATWTDSGPASALLRLLPTPALGARGSERGGRAPSGARRPDPLNSDGRARGTVRRRDVPLRGEPCGDSSTRARRGRRRSLASTPATSTCPTAGPPSRAREAGASSCTSRRRRPAWSLGSLGAPRRPRVRLVVATVAGEGTRPGHVDPESGHGRLSYRRAAELFSEYSGGRTLHQLRHTALTELAEANVSLPLLMAKSRHRSLRSLQRYARPGPEAVAALTASMDPERRRR